MFGYIKVNSDELKVSDYRLYRAVYCGLCKTMKKSIGRLSTLALSYDFVFLALLIADTMGEGFKVVPARCGLHPFKKRPVAKINTALEYAAGASAVLKYYKHLDDINDSVTFKRLGLRLLLPISKAHFQKALKCFSEYNFDILASDIQEYLEELSELERSGSSSCEKNAAVFGKLLSAVFENYFFNSDRAAAAQSLGYALGAYIYIADAFDDFQNDLEKGKYNPFIEAGYTELPENAVAATLSHLNTKAKNALAELPSSYNDIRRIMDNVIKLGLPTVFAKLVSKKNNVN